VRRLSFADSQAKRAARLLRVAPVGLPKRQRGQNRYTHKRHGQHSVFPLSLAAPLFYGRKLRMLMVVAAIRVRAWRSTLVRV
jgi:hypothetical protein